MEHLAAKETTIHTITAQLLLRASFVIVAIQSVSHSHSAQPKSSGEATGSFGDSHLASSMRQRSIEGNKFC